MLFQHPLSLVFPVFLLAPKPIHGDNVDPDLFLRHMMPLDLDEENGGSCGCDVFIVGLGWAGVGALHQLSEFKKIQKPDLCFKAADKAPVVGGRAIEARVISGKKGNPLFKFMKQSFTRKPEDEPDKEYLNWRVVDWYDSSGFDSKGEEIMPPRKTRRARRDFDDVFDCVTEFGEGFGPTSTVENLLNYCGSTATPSGGGYNGNYSNAILHWDFELEVRFSLSHLI